MWKIFCQKNRQAKLECRDQTLWKERGWQCKPNHLNNFDCKVVWFSTMTFYVWPSWRFFQHFQVYFQRISSFEVVFSCFNILFSDQHGQCSLIKCFTQIIGILGTYCVQTCRYFTEDIITDTSLFGNAWNYFIVLATINSTANSYFLLHV